MENNQIVKNQHIVPRQHLKNFTIPDSNRLECFNIDNFKIEKTKSPRSICCGYFHYALKPGEYDEYSQLVEKSFGDIENWYGHNIERIEKQLIDGQKLSDNDKYAVSWVIANFNFRGYRFRKELEKSSEKLVKLLQPIVGNYIYQNCLKEYPQFFLNSEREKEAIKNVTKKVLTEQTKNTCYATNRAFDVGFANTLTHKYWVVLINLSEEYPFITSDEAVITFANTKIPQNRLLSRSFLALTQIFHLSRKIAIIASYPFDEKMHGQTDFKIVTDDKKEIFKSNLFYVNYANKYAYASNRKFFDDLIKTGTNKKPKKYV